MFYLVGLLVDAFLEREGQRYPELLSTVRVLLQVVASESTYFVLVLRGVG